MYDWVGFQNKMPLNFTLHRGSDEVILHRHTILADETVNLTERVRGKINPFRIF